MVCKVSDDVSLQLNSLGTGYVGIGGQYEGTTGDIIYGLEDGDYFVPLELKDSLEAKEVYKRMGKDLKLFSQLFGTL